MNAPDMQRVRMSLPYYKSFGWEPVVVCVDEKFVAGYRDDLLLETVPDDIEVHKVKAWPLEVTTKFGLGSLSLRSYYSFKKKGTELLQQKKFDLVFFSTSLFHVCALGRYWKEKFGVPFLVDMQDPWRTDFYLNKPATQRPPKFKIAYAINKKMEAYTMPFADGIISVSQSYIDTLKARYSQLKDTPALLLPFGNAEKDFRMVKEKNIGPQIINRENGKINVVYVGALNKFFFPLIEAFFHAFIEEATNKELYHFYFIGSNYAVGSTDKMVEKLAERLNIKHLVTEIPDRISYFSAISTLLKSDIIFISGSIDPQYNPSKVYNNLFTGKPIFAVLNSNNHVKKILDEANAGIVVGVSETDDLATMTDRIRLKIPEFEQLHCRETRTDFSDLKKYNAETMVRKQVGFFDQILHNGFSQSNNTYRTFSASKAFAIGIHGVEQLFALLLLTQL